jgi:hypothetical protein
MDPVKNVQPAKGEESGKSRRVLKGGREGGWERGREGGREGEGRERGGGEGEMEGEREKPKSPESATDFAIARPGNLLTFLPTTQASCCTQAAHPDVPSPVRLS